MEFLIINCLKRICNRHPIKTEWTHPELSDIIVYPVKSASEISLKNSNLEQRGLVHDRRWMVVDDSAQFITQRTSPEMALLKTEIVDRTLKLNAPGMAELQLPLFQTEGIPQMVEIWEDRCEALAADKQAESWISDYLGKRCNFVFMPDHSNRQVDQDYAIGRNQVAFSDGFPLLLISESSLFDLNRRVPEEITMKRFRPNLVVKIQTPTRKTTGKPLELVTVNCK